MRAVLGPVGTGVNVKLKSLEIEGFKSFADKTVIRFDTDITGVVGPNGCGKSNIVDAIRWVLGEQSARHLRGRNMEDVIFSGTQGRPPASLASVELTFLTEGDVVPPPYDGHKEISIGRKLYRTGESEYYVNRQPARRKDITDIFLGTGVGTNAYSIIEQGQVDQVVMARPQDRRFIIEEAAGISKFKSRKEAAVRRMEATRQNLSRLHDVLTEIERQKSALERQAKKAQRFKVIADEYRALDLNLAALNFERLTQEETRHLDKIKEQNRQEEELKAGLARQEAEVEAHRLRLIGLEATLNELQQQVFEWDNSLKLSESKVQTKKEELLRCAREASRHQDELNELKRARQGARNGLSQVNERLALAELNCAELSEALVVKERDLKELTETSQKVFALIAQARERQNTASSKRSEITARKESLRQRLSELMEKKAADQKELDEHTRKYQSLEKVVRSAKNDLSEIRQLKLSLGQKTETLLKELAREEEAARREQRELAELKEELVQKRSRLNSLKDLERNFKGYQEGPRTILNKKREGTLDGVLGSVAEIIETDRRYENAVAAVLGERMQYIVVKNPEKGAQCVELLKTNKSGRGSFIPLNTFAPPEQPQARVVAEGAGYNIDTDRYLKTPDFDHGDKPGSAPGDGSGVAGQAGLRDKKGISGYLGSFVSFKPGFKDLAQVLFGDVLLAETLSDALTVFSELGNPVVTYDGEYISREGVLTGGTPETASKGLLKTRREINDLTCLLEGLVGKVSDKERICRELEKRCRGLRAELEQIKSSTHEEDLNLAKQEKDILHYTRELETLNASRDRLSQQIFQANEAIDRVREECEALEETERELMAVCEEAKGVLYENRGQEEAYRERLARHQEAVTRDKIALARAREQKAFLLQEVDRLAAEAVRLQREIIREEEQKRLKTKQRIFAEDRLAFLEKNIKRILMQKEKVARAYREKKNEFESLNNLVRGRDHELKSARHRYDQIKDELGGVTVKLTEVRGEKSRLTEQVLERYQLSLPEVFRDHLPDPETFDADVSRARAEELRKKLTQIGNVNLAAIDELSEVAERFEFLDKQKQDLETSLGSLERAIQKINRTTRERFKNTFELINERFTQLFPKLFSGGHAYLEMTDPENILETGVDIIAQPPGKKLQSISLLSGGEKALTAVSLLFAIFLIKPAPFCLLDEVDAPLDDANVDRYNDIVREMAERTQFVVITHNKRTMQVTDCLIGVTMPEAGVSQIVSVKLD